MKEDKKVSWEDIAWLNMYSIEALMKILENKGLITKQEVLGELQKLKVEHQKDVNQVWMCEYYTSTPIIGYFVRFGDDQIYIITIIYWVFRGRKVLVS